MKRILRLLLAFACLVSLVSPLLADTIRLKDGSVIRGRVVGFKDQQFTIAMGGGTKGRRGQTTVYVEDVESIEFDGNSESGAAPTGNVSAPETSTTSTSQPVRPNPNDSSVSIPRPVDTQPTASRSPTVFTIMVRKGQRLRISASGRVSLGRSRFSTPAGISTIPDNDKLMRNEPTGSLIGVIGDDNDDFLLIGTRRDFVAQRDGVLFLGVNEGDLADNTGSYDIVIEAEAGGGSQRP